MSKTVKCTNCNEEVIEMDCYDHSMYDDVVITKHVGECPICGKEFQWVCEYKLNKISNVEEILQRFNALKFCPGARSQFVYNFRC